MMCVAFPMAGLSSRFLEEGYHMPKYRLPLGNKFVFDFAVEPFLVSNFKNTLLFICRKDDIGASEFVSSRMESLQFQNFSIVEIDEVTSGQAETVYRGVENLHPKAELAIFNVDTFLLKYQKISMKEGEYGGCEGVIEVFEDDGENWSFVCVENDLVVKTAEKQKISHLASNGLYYFSSVQLYRNTYENFYINKVKNEQLGEKYIAPMYNEIINNGGVVKIKKIKREDIVFCGVPAEYENCKLIYPVS